MTLADRIEAAEGPSREPLTARAELHRQRLGLSYRKMGAETGVAFSTLARVLKGKGKFNRESARKIGAWLGDDVSEIITASEIRQAEEFGRKIARSFEKEIIAICAAALRAREARP